MSDPLWKRVLQGDSAALARSITLIEHRKPGYQELIAKLYREGTKAPVIGITGTPGAGKSTLVNELIGEYRKQGLRVAVLAVDPVSPFSGGALLGDRIRMENAIGDDEVFVRSMSTHGALGGLSPVTASVVTAMEAFGADRVIVETVGAGQNEVAIVRMADTIVVMVQPGTGDEVQMAKAGILEIGDIFVVNKADLPGVDHTVRELNDMISLGEELSTEEAAWTPPVITTQATTGQGVETLADRLEQHRSYLNESNAVADRRRSRYANEVETILQDELANRARHAIELSGGIDTIAERVSNRESDPYEEVDAIVTELLKYQQ